MELNKISSILEKNNFKSEIEKNKILKILEKGIVEKEDFKNFNLEEYDINLIANQMKDVTLYEDVDLERDNFFEKFSVSIINLNVKHYDNNTLRLVEDVSEKIVVKCNDNCNVLLFATIDETLRERYSINIIGNPVTNI